MRRYLVEIEEGLPVDARKFTSRVERILADPRSWAAGEGFALRRVSSGRAAFRVTLASPDTTDRLCAPLQTGGIFSCFQRGRSVLNHGRWSGGSPVYPGDLASYRAYMVNHEVGHALGHGHLGCPAAGRLAPVMMQQSKGLAGCRPNAWPLPGELR